MSFAIGWAVLLGILVVLYEISRMSASELMEWMRKRSAPGSQEDIRETFIYLTVIGAAAWLAMRGAW